jgi:hypothetical protein
MELVRKIGSTVWANGRVAVRYARTMTRRVYRWSWCLLALCACSSGDDGGAERDGGPPRDVGVARDGGPRDSGILPRDAGPRDAGDLTCRFSCQCPQGVGCIDGVCRAVGQPIYCCDKAGCPNGAPCLDTTDRPRVCDGDDLPDAGSCRYDGGPPPAPNQPVGGACADDTTCADGLTCWTRDEAPGFWGYCTISPCETSGCPVGSACFQFPNGPTGCLQLCQADPSCRPDAHCVEAVVPGANGVCVTDCRDDVIDCDPRDGTWYCNRATGRCASTPLQQVGSRMGGRCKSTVDCGMGEVCFSELGWGFPCGMCAQICSGTPEATPCPTGSTCQPYGDFGVCFVDCASDGTCPQRTDAVCDRREGWATDACIPTP